jgi:hypothetical protein
MIIHFSKPSQADLKGVENLAFTRNNLRRRKEGQLGQIESRESD